MQTKMEDWERFLGETLTQLTAECHELEKSRQAIGTSWLDIDDAESQYCDDYDTSNYEGGRRKELTSSQEAQIKKSEAVLQEDAEELSLELTKWRSELRRAYIAVAEKCLNWIKEKRPVALEPDPIFDDSPIPAFFEELVAQIFSYCQMHEIRAWKRTGIGAGRDWGCDVLGTTDSVPTMVVQCKAGVSHFKKQPAIIRDLLGSMVVHKVKKGAIVYSHAGKLTSEATAHIDAAKDSGYDIIVLMHKDIIGLLNEMGTQYFSSEDYDEDISDVAAAHQLVANLFPKREIYRPPIYDYEQPNVDDSRSQDSSD